ncbi:MAG TPA: methyltransferase domain-containing protein [Candidatus Binatia bacterium]|nr:methyltransferase domain-containing protein [Candidatus Binatia bacterium]
MDAQVEFESLRRETSSWWYISRRKLLRDAVAQAVRDRREARVLDLGGCAELEVADSPQIRALNVHASLPLLAFHQIQGRRDLVCTSLEELGISSGSFDVIVAGDVLQTVPDDLAALRELRRVLRDGATLCLTVPAYPSLWGEEDEVRGHRRRYTATGLRRRLNNCGFEVTRVSYLVASGFIPAVLERIGKNIFSRSIQRYRRSVRHARWMDSVMLLLLECERFMIRFINLPFGTRVVCWARKPALVMERVTVPAWERQWARRPLAQGSSYSPLPGS